MNPIVSIIVPVYNAEKTLCRCVDSVLAQEYPHYELLLADDGSSDGSSVICDGYAAADSRVRVFHKPNTGVSDTRNQALARAGGTYLQFLDSDDWLTPDATRLLVEAAEAHQCDLVIADFYRVVGERFSHKGDIDENTLLTREEYAAHMMENPADFYYGVLWNKLYRREIVEQYHLRMDPEISWCEDFMFNLEYIRRTERIYALQTPIYYYVKTKGSLATQGLNITKTIQMKLTVFEYYQKFYKTVLDEEEYEKSRLKIYKFLLDAAKDGAVPPVFGGQRLGKDRGRIQPERLEGEGALLDACRERKLMEHYLEPAAVRHELSLPEAGLLLSLRQLCGAVSRQELADFTGLSRGSLSVSLQRLASRGFIKTEDSPGRAGLTEHTGRKRVVFLTSASDPVLEDLAAALDACAAARLSGFTEEERAQYTSMAHRIQENIRDILR